jgi:serine/threonine protein kinase
VAWAGRGVYGAVYKAVRVGEEHAGPVALKLGLFPGDPRFTREAELLRRLSHPSIPHLHDHGHWQHPSGALHPYLAMEWIEGMALYDWAQRHNPTSQQLLRPLAQLARALEALHAQGAVHRDVKGANIRVRLSDGRAFLTDFGSGNYPGTSTLTPDDVFPGTPAYRSPEAWMFSLRFGRARTARYHAGPADDLFSLGMTGYRLLTGKYLELTKPTKDEAGTWHLAPVAPPPQLVLNPRVPPQLSALILRMLSVSPEQRGTATQLAEALESAAESTVPSSAPPSLSPPMPPSVTTHDEQTASTSVPAPEKSPAEKGSIVRSLPRENGWPRRAWLTMATAGLALLAWAWWTSSRTSLMPPSSLRPDTALSHQEDGGTKGLGEAASPASAVTSPDSSDPQVLTQDTLPEPLPGQLRPDATGRCPHKRQVALNSGCWVPLAREECEALNGQIFRGRCYVPAMSSQRQPPFRPARKP